MKADTSIQRRAPLLVIFLVVLLDMLGFGVVFPLLPICARDFGAGENGFLIGLLAASFSAMQCIFSPFWGRLSDRIGRRTVLVAGLAGSALCYGLLGRAIEMQSLTWLFVVRAGSGIFAATVTTAQAYVADRTPPHMRARGMTLISVALGLGFTLGPILGGSFTLLKTDQMSAAGGYAAAAFSACALLLACSCLVEPRGVERARTVNRPFDKESIWKAVCQPAVLPLLCGLFLSVSAFSVFEATLPLVLTKGSGPKGPLRFGTCGVMFAFSYLGATIALVQGFIVRPLLALVSEGVLAAVGAILQILGFAAMTATVLLGSLVGLLTAATLLVVGLALLMPSLNSLISRRTDPSNQGGILGISQSAGALARVVGPLLGVTLLYRPFVLPLTLPYLVGSCLTAVALVTIKIGCTLACAR
jgi:MFS transporter, DHA1 family, tetracycline resistance protein